MVAKIPTLPVDVPVPDLLLALEQCGAVIVENFLAETVVRSLNLEFDGVLNSESRKEQRFVNLSLIHISEPTRPY